jgi:hypothetical protein
VDAVELRKPALATFDIEAPLGLRRPSPTRLYLLWTRVSCEKLWPRPIGCPASVSLSFLDSPGQCLVPGRHRQSNPPANDIRGPPPPFHFVPACL